MLFKDIIGQQGIKKRLVTQVRENRISHALLFLGREGYGGLPLAIAFSQYINCQQRTDSDACGICPSCIKYQKLIHPDLHFVYPVNTTKKVLKDPVSDDFITEWRELILQNPYFRLSRWYDYIGIENKQGIISKNESANILKKLGLKTFEADYKIMIIWIPEKMNQTSANKLLKILEEPPENTIFMLVAENTEDIIPTILSRTQLIKIPRINIDLLTNKLMQEYSMEKENAQKMAKIAEGDFIEAIDKIELDEDLEYFLDQFSMVMRLCYKKNVTKLIGWAEELSALNREKQKSFITYAVSMIRENLVMHLDTTSLVHLNQAEQDFSLKFHPYINGKNVIPISNILNTAQEHIERNANAKIVFTDMSLKLMKYIKK